MSTLKIQERFSLDAPPELVWDYLIDPARMVACLPGAELTGQEDERTYSGAMKVKVGAVTVSYSGKLTFEEIDQERGYFRVLGKGREKSGSGSVTLTMEGRVLALDDGGSEVTIDSEVRLTGKIVRFGRGMIESVSAEVFKDFKVRLTKMMLAASELDGANEPEAEDAAMGASSGSAETDDVLHLVPLLLRAFRSWLAKLFGGR